MYRLAATEQTEGDETKPTESGDAAASDVKPEVDAEVKQEPSEEMTEDKKPEEAKKESEEKMEAEEHHEEEEEEQFPDDGIPRL